MAKTIVGLFDDLGSARAAVQELLNSGILKADISLISNDATGEYGNYVDRLSETDVFETSDAQEGATVGAGVGAAIGGLGGLLVGLGAFAIPGIGPVVAAGPLAATISGLVGAGAGAVAGGAAGGLLGAIMDLGIPEEAAHEYAEGLRRGGHLVVVSTNDELSGRAVAILNEHGAVDIKDRAHRWRERGWTRFDEQAGPFTGDAVTETFPADYHRSELSSDFGTDYDDFRAYESGYRDHFARSLGAGSQTFEEYEPAYRYGYDLANDLRYRDWAWEDLEAEARHDWDQRHPGTWERFRSAVQHAWQEVKESVS
jgi:hypothetical protein